MCTLSLAEVLCIGNAVHQLGALSLNDIHLPQDYGFSTVLIPKLHKWLQLATLQAPALTSIHLTHHMDGCKASLQCKHCRSWIGQCWNLN